MKYEVREFGTIRELIKDTVRVGQREEKRLRLKQGKVIVALFAMKGGTSGGQQQWPKPNAELEARGKRSKKPVGPTKQKRPHFVRSSHDWGSHRDAESDKGAACRFWGRSGVYSNPPAGERRLPGESSECPFSMFSEAPETICTSRTFGEHSAGSAPPPTGSDSSRLL